VAAGPTPRHTNKCTAGYKNKQLLTDTSAHTHSRGQNALNE